MQSQLRELFIYGYRQIVAERKACGCKTRPALYRDTSNGMAFRRVHDAVSVKRCKRHQRIFAEMSGT